MDLPGLTDTLVSRLTAANPNIAVVVQSGTPVTMPWANEAAAIVQAWYGGNEAGNAIADVLFGDCNPSGKLPLTFPLRNEDNPAFLNFRSEACRTIYREDVYVGYRFYEKTLKNVLYPFGHGLSYSNFVIDNLRLEETPAPGAKLAIAVDVHNNSHLSGQEVVQVYVRQCNPSINRPMKELKGFAKVHVPGHSVQTVEMPIDKIEVARFWDERREMWIVEKDNYEVLVGSSSDKISQTGTFQLGETAWWPGSLGTRE